MGEWAKSLFGQESFERVGLVLAGTSHPKIEKQILSLFDKVISKKDAVYHAYLVEQDKKRYPIVFNVYGAPAMVDVMTEMHDGGCRTLIFVGYAYGGFRNLEIGTIVVPDKSYHFDGIYHPIEPDRKVAFADKKVMKKIEEVITLDKIKHVKGTNISVPAVTFQLPHANREYQRIKPSTVEMELAACFSRAKDIGIRSAGVLVVSDNKTTHIGDDTKKVLRYTAKMKVVKSIIENIEVFDVPPLSRKKPFKVNEYLASIIEYPSDKRNVYRESK